MLHAVAWSGCVQHYIDDVQYANQNQQDEKQCDQLDTAIDFNLSLQTDAALDQLSDLMKGRERQKVILLV